MRVFWYWIGAIWLATGAMNAYLGNSWLALLNGLIASSAVSLALFGGASCD